ncbi:LysR family transcriptional regulator [Nocardia sp. NPDC056100]|uniref:LysR family transcriptional regulator n=1 Tax=Nocardia sp. NPDC056100 TaxID=3345712 RepID=UPI0035E09FCA
MNSQRRPDVTLTQLRYFVEAATFLSMTRAAERLMVAQSAISSSISQLENQIGTPLFIRQRSRGLVLTAAGEQMLRDTRSVLAHLGDVLDAARGHEDAVRGRVRLASFITLTPFLLPRLISDVGQAYPELEIDVVEVRPDTVRAALRDGSSELALCYDLGIADDLDCEVLATYAPHVVLPPDHRLAGAAAIELRDLADDPMVLLDLPVSRDYFLAMFTTAGITPTVRYRTGSYEAVRGLVARGHGFSILNQLPASDVTYDGGRVVTVPIADDVEPLSVVLASLKGVQSTARVRAVATRIRATFAT